MIRRGFKIPELVKKFGFWAFTVVIGAGFTMYMDTDRNKQAIAQIQKNLERFESDVVELRADQRMSRETNDEKNRKSLEKLDQLIVMMERRRK